MKPFQMNSAMPEAMGKPKPLGEDKAVMKMSKQAVKKSSKSAKGVQVGAGKGAQAPKKAGTAMPRMKVLKKEKK